MGYKGEEGVKNLKKLVTSFMDGPKDKSRIWRVFDHECLRVVIRFTLKLFDTSPNFSSFLHLCISGEEEKFGDVSKSFRVKVDDQLITIPKRFEMQINSWHDTKTFWNVNKHYDIKLLVAPSRLFIWQKIGS